MALERQLWQRVKRGGLHLRACGYGVHLCRVENDAGSGHPDVEGSIDGRQVWIELKSCERPKRATTVCRPKLRDSQSIWMKDRSASGASNHWLLIQVGEGSTARLYLIPGTAYDKAIATETDLAKLSVCTPGAEVASVLLIAMAGY